MLHGHAHSLALGLGTASTQSRRMRPDPAREAEQACPDAVEDVASLLLRGQAARRVGETKLNRESSRSHSVFTCTLERTTTDASGITQILRSRLNLVDLAGGPSASRQHPTACHVRASTRHPAGTETEKGSHLPMSATASGPTRGCHRAVPLPYQCMDGAKRQTVPRWKAPQVA